MVALCLPVSIAWAQPSLPPVQELPDEGSATLAAPLVLEGAPLEAEPWTVDPADLRPGSRRGGFPGYSSVPPLPAILVSLSSGYRAEQVPVTIYRTVTESRPAPMAHRRRSLASRGAHTTLSGWGPQTIAVRRTVAETVYRTVYRRRYQQLDLSPLIQKYADRFALDPWLVRGVIEVESAFQPHACSGAGAGGLMQLMPGTAAYLGCRDRFDPEENIAAGARYLRSMLNRFNNDYDLAIAAYNAGPGNVERYGGVPPFAETQNYVRKVRRAWARKPGN